MKENEWVLFTKRTNDPKLSWLEAELNKNNIPTKRTGWSFHAPVLRVKKADENRAWEILSPIDNIPDDDPRFFNGPECEQPPLDDEQSRAYFNRFISGDR